MEQLERVLQHVPQRLLSGKTRSFTIVTVKPRLYQLDVPVTQFAPDEVVEEPCPFSDVIALQGPSELFRRIFKPAENPPVGPCQL